MLGFFWGADVFSFLDTSELLIFVEFRCIFGGSDVFHYDLRGDSPGAGDMWQRGLLIYDEFRGVDTSGLPIFMEFRCIHFGDTSESDIITESRCIWNVWFLEHTSEMHGLGPFRCIVTLVSVGDTSGLRILCPSRCTEAQIYI